MKEENEEFWIPEIVQVDMEESLRKSRKHRNSLIQFVSEIHEDELIPGQIVNDDEDDGGDKQDENENTLGKILILPAPTFENVTKPIPEEEEEEIVPENHSFTEIAPTMVFAEPSEATEEDIVPQVQPTTQNIPSFEETLMGMADHVNEENTKDHQGSICISLKLHFYLPFLCKHMTLK